jgi:hypothetical protein
MREPSATAGLGEVPETAILLKGVYPRPRGDRGSFAYYGFSDHYIARWRLLCDFQISRDGSCINCQPWAEVPWSDIKPFLLGRILPLALNLRGVLTLHSGAVLFPHGAIAIVAVSGTGKSTLAATLTCLGHSLVADDVLAIREQDGEYYAELGGPQVRLTEESLGFLGPQLPSFRPPEPDYDKVRVHLREDGIGAGPKPLRAIYLLDRRPREEGEDIRFLTLPAKEALPILLRNINNYVLLERTQLEHQFAMIARLVGQVPVIVLAYPSGLDLLPKVCAKLLERHGSLGDSVGSISSGANC